VFVWNGRAARFSDTGVLESRWMGAPAASPTLEIDPVQTGLCVSSWCSAGHELCALWWSSEDDRLVTLSRFNGTAMDGLASRSFRVATTHVSGSFSAGFSSGLTSRFCRVSCPWPCLISCVETLQPFFFTFQVTAFTRASVCYSSHSSSPVVARLLLPCRWRWCRTRSHTVGLALEEGEHLGSRDVTGGVVGRLTCPAPKAGPAAVRTDGRGFLR
jgi:hypothetical protein